MSRQYTLQPRTPSAASINYAEELNAQQLAAVTCPPGPALVIAGAGSGKTRTLTYRVAYLLDNGVQPDNILLLTFTNKAAREMLDRVEALVTADTFRLWGGTFHSIGNRILRRNVEKIGYRPNFSILDREDQKDLISTAIVESAIDPKAVRFPKPDVLANMFSLAVNTEEELHEIVACRFPYFSHLTDAIEKVRARYEEKKVDTNSMDFDDLLTKTYELLANNPEIAARYQHQFQFILVDEYQDTNKIQADFIDLLAGEHGNIMVVGDDAQSIYSWRGANFENILKFPKRYPEAQVYKIECNYRSVPEILRFSNAAIAANRKQFEKELRAVRPDREILPGVIPLNDPGTQAAFLAQRILELRDEGIELNEIAVLYRAHFHSMEIQMELTRRGIPFVITSGLRFFEQAHIKDVAAFMKFAVNRRDEVAFKRMTRMLPGIGGKSADNLWRSWTECGGSKDAVPESFSKFLLEFKVPAKAKKGWEQLAYTLDELIAGGAPVAPTEMIHSVIEGVYEDYLVSKYTNFESRRQDLEQLMRYAGGFESMEEFLSQLALLTGVDTEPTAAERDSEAVCLSSVHQAKGLEWRVVFVVWLTEGMFPNARVLEHDEDEEGLEEERRLFYVAATRAKDELYLTYPYIWPSSHSGDVVQRPSRFLEDIPREYVEEWEVGRSFA